MDADGRALLALCPMLGDPIQTPMYGVTSIHLAMERFKIGSLAELAGRQHPPIPAKFILPRIPMHVWPSRLIYGGAIIYLLHLPGIEACELLYLRKRKSNTGFKNSLGSVIVCIAALTLHSLQSEK